MISSPARYFITVFNYDEVKEKFKSRTCGFTESSTEALDAVEHGSFIDGSNHTWLCIERIEPGLGFGPCKDIENFPDLWYHLDENHGTWIASSTPTFAETQDCMCMHHNISV